MMSTDGAKRFIVLENDQAILTMMKKERKTQNVIFGWLIAAAVIIILLVILESIKITPLETYTDPQYHFSLKYPAFWKKIDRPEKGMGLVQFIAPRSSDLDQFAENVNLSLVDLSRKPGMDLRGFTHLTTQQLLGVFGDYVNVLESKEIRLGGRPAYRFSYVTQSDTFATQSKITYFHVWTLRGRFALILTFVGDQEGFDKNLPHVNRMIRTFKFLR